MYHALLNAQIRWGEAKRGIWEQKQGVWRGAYAEWVQDQAKERQAYTEYLSRKLELKQAYEQLEQKQPLATDQEEEKAAATKAPSTSEDPPAE